MSKTVEIQLRIKFLEGKLKKSGNALGIEAGLGNATVDGWTDNQIEKPTLAVEKFLKHHNISPEWWRTGKGEAFLTPVKESADYKENASTELTAYKTFFEGRTEYVLIPRTVMDKTRLVSIDELDRKNEMIDFFQGEFAKLLEGLRLAPKPSKPEKGDKKG